MAESAKLLVIDVFYRYPERQWRVELIYSSTLVTSELPQPVKRGHADCVSCDFHRYHSPSGLLEEKSKHWIGYVYSTFW